MCQSNNDRNNFIMKIHVLLIVLDFTQICVSLQTNTSIHNDPKHITSRGKRELAEYTRWHPNLLMSSTSEFIVKVDDEVFAPTRSTPVIGINIQSAVNDVDPIVIGGAIDLPMSTPNPDTTPIEYTRFVPPTTVRETRINDIARTNLREVQGHLPPFSVEKHARRDESPPAGPHFITRTPSLAHQFTPITFRTRGAASPVTLPDVTQGLLQYSSPTRTSNFILTRTTAAVQDFNMPQLLSDDAQELKSFLLSKNEMQTDTIVTRTSTSTPLLKTNNPTWSDVIGYTPMKQEADVDLDTYHLTFNEDYNDKNDDGKKKSDESQGDDTQKDKFTASAKDAESEEETNDLYIDIKGMNRRTYGEKMVTSPVGNINNASEKLPTITKQVEDRERRTCSIVKFNHSLKFEAPRTLAEIVQQLKKWTEKSPIAKLIDITANNLTTMDNPIYMMKVDDPSSGQVVSAKDVVMIVAGIQGRDHYAASAAMYVLYQLIEHTATHSELLNKYRFWIIPVFNPDGYDYSMTFSNHRNWMKNLRQSWADCNRGQKSCKDCKSYGLRCIVQSCYGVHLDRNFEYQWIPATELRAEHPCGDLYAGSRQLSEPETRALTTYLHEQKEPLSVFVAFKEGDVLGVMYPYSHTKKKRAFDANYRSRASRAASAAFTVSGRPYVAGQTSEFLPLYAGGIEDWIDGHLGIDNTYSVMMFRPSDSYHTDSVIAQHVVHEAYAALDTLLLENTDQRRPSMEAIKISRKNAGNVALPTLVFLPAAIIFNS